MSKARKLWIAAIFSVVVFAASYFTYAHTSLFEQSSKDTSFFLNLHDTVDYVGMETCKGCHSDKHETFIHTGMGLSFDLATSSKSAAFFNNVNPIYDKNRDLYYFPFWKQGSLYISEYRLNGKDTIHYREEKISHIIGSGQHTNSHFWNDNGFLYQAPLTYYTQKGKWDLPPGFEVTNTSFHRKIDIECMSCHNGIPKINAQSINFFEKIPLGIDCERCHGPGELHVNQKRNGIIVNTQKEADRSIVNPKRLPFSLQIDICQRCHLQGNNVLKPGKRFTDFKPGMKLSDVFEIYMPKYENNDYFVMAGHADRFQKSACFIKSNRGNTETYNPNINFTCINCHDPHVSVKKTKMQGFNQQCQNCHTTSSEKSSLKKCKLPISEQNHQNGCVGCHMPASGSEDIPHVLVHDHKIQRPSKSLNLEKNKGKLLGLYAVNNPNPEKSMLVKAYLSYFEKFDANPLYIEKAHEIIGNENRGENALLLHYLKANYTEVVKLSKTIDIESADAWQCYRIAKSMDKTSDLIGAKEWYERAYNKMNLNLDFGAEYANCLIRLKNIPSAKEILNANFQKSKKHELTLLNLASCYYLEGKYAEAKRLMTKTLELNPDQIEALMFLAELHLKFNETEQCDVYLKRVLKLRNRSSKSQQITLDQLKQQLQK